MRILTALLAAAPLIAADSHTLFNPVPKEQMRELSTDRPDTTESPYTVDAGHFQAELEPVSWSRDRSEGKITHSISSSYNLKAGLTTWSDLQVTGELWRRETVSDDSISGIGDMDIRLKLNMWGNDEGDTAFALMPFVTLPTHDQDFGEERDVTGGLIAPLGLTLPAGWSAALMLELDVVRNAADDGYTVVWVQSATASHAIAGDVGGFMELVVVSPTEDESPGEAYANGGLTWGVNADLQLDCGTNIGLTQASEDLRLFAGVSFRL